MLSASCAGTSVDRRFLEGRDAMQEDRLPLTARRGPIWVPKVSFLGVLGVVLVYKSGLRILIRAPKVPFLVPPKWLKSGHFSQF